MVEVTIDDQPAQGPGDLLLEIRYVRDALIAWDPNGATEVARAYLDEANEEPAAFRAALRTLGEKIAANRNYVEGGGY